LTRETGRDTFEYIIIMNIVEVGIVVVVVVVVVVVGEWYRGIGVAARLRRGRSTPYKTTTT
jgi:hypothetical protein